MADEQLDLRGMAPGERGELVREAFEQLDTGEVLGVVSDIDPHPMYYELTAEKPIDEEESEIQERDGGLFAAWFVRA